MLVILEESNRGEAGEIETCFLCANEGLHTMYGKSKHGVNQVEFTRAVLRLTEDSTRATTLRGCQAKQAEQGGPYTYIEDRLLYRLLSI